MTPVPPKIRFNFWLEADQRDGLRLVKERDGVPRANRSAALLPVGWSRRASQRKRPARVLEHANGPKHVNQGKWLAACREFTQTADRWPRPARLGGGRSIVAATLTRAAILRPRQHVESGTRKPAAGTTPARRAAGRPPSTWTGECPGGEGRGRHSTHW